MLADLFESKGFEVLTATNGLEALLHIIKSRPSGVVLDLMMPRLGGLETLRHIHELDPALNVVVVTGFLDPELHRRALEAGARFVHTKPVNLMTLVNDLTPGTAASPLPSARAPARVLIIDDDPHVRSLLEDALRLAGVEVVTADDGAEGLRRAIAAPPDVILLDLHLPSLRGIDALVSLRAVLPDVQVIVVSGTEDEVLRRRALAYGAFDFLTKPVDLEQLRDGVEKALAMKRLGLS